VSEYCDVTVPITQHGEREHEEITAKFRSLSKSMLIDPRLEEDADFVEDLRFLAGEVVDSWVRTRDDWLMVEPPSGSEDDHAIMVEAYELMAPSWRDERVAVEAFLNTGDLDSAIQVMEERQASTVELREAAEDLLASAAYPCE
jgi:hypothetical protein